jgi:hypothetical protein
MRHIPCLIGLLLAGGMNSFASAQPTSYLGGACTVVSPPGTGFLLDYTVDPPEQEDLTVGQIVKSDTGLRTVADNRVLIYLSAGRRNELFAQISVYLDAESQIRLGPQRATNRQLLIEQGSLVIHYQAGDDRPLVVAAGNAWVRLERGSIFVSLNERKPLVALVSAEGTATRFDGPVPEGDAKDVEGGEALSPTPAGVEAESARKLRQVLHGAMGMGAPSAWLARAERGDLTPTQEEGVALAQFEVPQVQSVTATETTTEVTAAATAAANVLPPISTTTVTPPAQRISGVQSLLTSGNPPSVVVGTRLERARVVGVPAPASGLGFNRAVRAPINLNPVP